MREHSGRHKGIACLSRPIRRPRMYLLTYPEDWQRLVSGQLVVFDSGTCSSHCPINNLLPARFASSSCQPSRMARICTALTVYNMWAS